MVSFNPTRSVIALMTFIISALLITVGIGAANGYTYSNQATATVISATCRSVGTTLYDCTLRISYPHKGNPVITEANFLGNRSYQANDQLTIYYNPNDLQTVSNSDMAPTMFVNWNYIIAGLAVLVAPYGLNLLLKK